MAFGLGISLPIVAFERFFFLSDSYSILSLVVALWDQGEFLLTVIIGGFSVLLPAIKLILLAVVQNARLSGWSARSHITLASLGRWSMMDVLVVALLIVAMKTSGVATALSQPGLYCYSASVLLTMLAASLRRSPPSVR